MTTDADTYTADRTVVHERGIAAPADAVRAAWSDPEALPTQRGRDGFTCRAARIDLRTGRERVFDMIGPDGTVFPNHHRYHRFDRAGGIDYTLRAGEDGPKRAGASVRVAEAGGRTRTTLRTVFVNAEEEHETAKGSGAVGLGYPRLGKLARLIGED